MIVMRYILAFALIMSLLTTHARCAEFTVTNKCQSFTVTNRTKPKTTLCGCAFTNDCTCWNGECACSACGLGGAAKQAPKASAPRSAVNSTRITPVPAAGTLVQPGKEPGSSALSPQADSTLTPALGVAFPGGTSGAGCANGNCPAPTKSNGFFRRR